MKPKVLKKRLVLNKKTIADLRKPEMDGVYGGDNSLLRTECTCTDTCLCSIFETCACQTTVFSIDGVVCDHVSECCGGTIPAGRD
jgi:hypothetical protein